MQRSTLMAVAGAVSLLLAALLWERPSTGAPTMPSRAMLVAQDDSVADASAEAHADTAANTSAPQDDPGSAQDAWLTALAQLEFEPFDQAAPVIAQALRCPDRDVRLRAVNLLIAAKDNPAILPLLGVAQADPDAEVRRDAITALANSPLKENLTPYLLRGAFDMDADVREALVQTAWSLAPGQRDDFVAQALHSSWPEISSAAFAMLSHEPTPKTVELLLNVYATNNVALIQQANDVMSGLVNQTFSNAAEAASWWQAHQSSYTDDLSTRTDDPSANP